MVKTVINYSKILFLNKSLGIWAKAELRSAAAGSRSCILQILMTLSAVIGK